MASPFFFWGHTDRSGPKKCLSNWFPAKFVDSNGITYDNTEQYMMYHKALLFKDSEMASAILKNPNPKEIKAMGRKVKNFDWNIWSVNAKKNCL